MKEKYFIFCYKDSMFLKFDLLKDVEKMVDERFRENGVNMGEICIIEGKELEIKRESKIKIE